MNFKGLFTIPLLALLVTGCANNANNQSSGDKILVHVLNAEDYIDVSLLDTFSEMVSEKDGKNVQIVYDTYDTNETMYNTIKTGKTSYDLICASDYMVQRLAREKAITRFDYDLLPNYSTYASEFLYSRKDDSGKLNNALINTDEGTYKLSEYFVGYMWGTLGVVYNPNFILNKNRSIIENDDRFKGMDDDQIKEKIIELFNSDDGYSLFRDDILTGTQSIKDSMRDTYALGIFEVFKDYFLTTSDDYEARDNHFNLCDDETINLVKDKLIELKGNIFGFEVDSGKNDIVTEKIGVNLAWSGDAVNSINRGYYADDDWTIPSENPVDLYYAIPSIGANVWSDGWCMPTHDDSYYQSDEYKYAMEFLDFLSNPENAVLNESYNGYTSYIGANDKTDDETSKIMLSYILYSYDLSDGDEDEDLSQYDVYDITPFFDFEEEVTIDTTYVSETIFEDEGEDIDSRTFTFKKDENGKVRILIHTDLSSLEGRTLKAQFPQESDVDRLYMMRDFESQNSKILQMWEDVKVNPLPTWVVVSLVTFVVLVLGYLGSYRIIRHIKLKRRKELRKN